MTATQLVRIVGPEKAVELVMVGGRLPTMNGLSEEFKRLLVLKLYGEGLPTVTVAERSGLTEDGCRNIRNNPK